MDESQPESQSSGFLGGRAVLRVVLYCMVSQRVCCRIEEVVG